MSETSVQARNPVGILAYGSLIVDPGVELEPLIIHRFETLTPFPVEFARLSTTRGGAPTVVPHASGKPVRAVVLVLMDRVERVEARNLLWRRETRNERSVSTYHEDPAADAVIVRELAGFCGLEHVLYTDFKLEGKIADPDPVLLAKAAVASVGRAAPGKDGISYLRDLIGTGIETALTPRLVAEILSQTATDDLEKTARRLGILS